MVGAGPVGLRCATRLAEKGFSVKVFEDHGEVGTPVNCSGLISKSNTDSLGIPVKECTVNEIRGARIFAPNTTMLEVERKEPVAYVVDRAQYDKVHLKQAQDAGVQIQYHSRVIDARGGTLFVKVGERGEMEKSKVIVGADGVQSKVRKIMGFEPGSESFVHSIQMTAKGKFDPHFVEVHLGPFAPGYFAWVIPESKSVARMGLGFKVGTNPNEAFKKFIESRGFEVETCFHCSALIPCTPPMKNVVKENMALVGDAAMQAKATTGGGLILGAMAADILSESIIGHLKNGTALTQYEKNLKDLNKEFNLHWKIRQYFNALNEDQVNRLFIKAKKAGVEEFLSKEGDMDMPSKFIGKALARPRLFLLAPQLLRMALA